jgi:hypothetical protein
MINWPVTEPLVGQAFSLPMRGAVNLGRSRLFRRLAVVSKKSK